MLDRFRTNMNKNNKSYEFLQVHLFRQAEGASRSLEEALKQLSAIAERWGAFVKRIFKDQQHCIQICTTPAA